MIWLSAPPQFGVQLFLETFGRLLALRSGLWLEPITVPSILTPFVQEEGNYRYLSPAHVIDGDWPRFRDLNLPLPPNFFARPMQGRFILAGGFRNWSFYEPNRDVIRAQFFGIKSSQVKKGRVVVFARFFRHSATDLAEGQFQSRPTIDELRELLPDHVPSETLMITAMPDRAIERSWRLAGYSVASFNNAAAIRATEDADTVVANEDEIAWWSGFLSNASKVILLSFGGRCRVCARASDARLGGIELLYNNERVKWVDMPKLVI